MTDSGNRAFHGVAFDIPPARGHQIFAVFGIRKSGSSIFNNICTALAKFNGVPFVDVGGKLFGAGIAEHRWIGDPDIANILVPGAMYGGFRSFPSGFAATEAYKNTLKVCLVRDPRDALVSEYFSNAYSHSMPEAGEAAQYLTNERARALSSDLAEYVASRIDHMGATCRPFVALANDPNVRIYRYEDVIFEKSDLMRDVCSHFGWSVTQQQIDLILKWADVRPDTERPGQFVRRVTPGDYLDKMPDDLQEKVIAEMGDFMSAFGYT